MAQDKTDETTVQAKIEYLFPLPICHIVLPEDVIVQLDMITTELLHAPEEDKDDHSGQLAGKIHEGQQIADEVRRGGFELLRLGDASADVVGLVELAPGVLSVASGPLHDRSLAEYAVDSCGALGVTAVAVGPTEWSRAVGVTLAAGAVLAVGSSIVHPGL